MYNHRSNAGNKADKWKHKILMQLVNVLKPRLYFESHCGYASYKIEQEEEEWLSSWMKVWLHSKCHCTLCDINPEILTAIPIGNIEFIHGDGWEQIYYNRNYDLYFVDPPYDTPINTPIDFMQLFYLFSNFKYPLVAWYPLFDKATPILEANHQMEIQFDEPEGKLIGCGMAFKNIDTNIIKQINL